MAEHATGSESSDLAREVVRIMTVHRRSAQEILEGQMPYVIRQEDPQTGHVIVAEGRTEQEARETLDAKIRASAN